MTLVGCVFVVDFITGEMVTFQIRVRPAQLNMTDLYILMDISFSMSMYLHNLRVLASNIGNLK